MPVDINGGGVPELNGVVVALGRVGAWAAQTAYDIKDIPVVGKALSMPFVTLSLRIGDVNTSLTHFLIAYQKLMDALRTGDVSASFEAALDLLIPSWRLLRDNPLSWIMNQLSQAYPHSTLLFRNPGQWLLEQLGQAFPVLLDFLQDAEGFVLKIVQDAIAGLGDFLRDPGTWLRAALCELLGVDDSFWQDPFGNIILYIMRWIEQHLIEFAKWLYPLAERVLRYFWEGEI